ncbi:hypothetical protein HK405_002380, partial [Cladochytrium tenue]
PDLIQDYSAMMEPTSPPPPQPTTPPHKPPGPSSPGAAAADNNDADSTRRIPFPAVPLHRHHPGGRRKSSNGGGGNDDEDDDEFDEGLVLRAPSMPNNSRPRSSAAAAAATEGYLPPLPLPPAPSVALRRYALDEGEAPIATALSTVRFGTDARTGEPVVFKIVDDAESAAIEIELLREAEALGVPHVVRLLDVVPAAELGASAGDLAVDGGGVVLVMPRLERMPTRITELAQVARHARELLSALNGLHAVG